MNKLFGLFLLALACLATVSTGYATLVTLPSPILYPGIYGQSGNTPSVGTDTTVASGQYYSMVFTAREDMVISHVGVRVTAATASPTADFRIETVGSTGLPSGTLWATNTNAVSGTLTAGSNPLVALTASATISKGQVFAVKIAYASGTSFAVGLINNFLAPLTSGMPYKVVDTGTPTKSIPGNGQTIALGSSSTTFYFLPGTIPVASFTGNNFNNSTAGAARGLLFTAAMNARIVGVRFYNGTSQGDYNVCVRDFAGNELSNSCTAVDGDTNATSVAAAPQNNYLDNTVTITAGTQYRVTIEPTTTTNVTVGTFGLPSANYRSGTPAGSNAQYTTFTTAGGWVDSATDTIPLLDVIIDQIDNGTSTGGGGRIIGG